MSSATNPTPTKRRASSSIKAKTPPLLCPYKDMRVRVPGEVWQEPGVTYEGVVQGWNGQRTDQLLLFFAEDRSRYWFPVRDVDNWLAATPGSQPPSEQQRVEAPLGQPRSPSPAPRAAAVGCKQGAGSPAAWSVHSRQQQAEAPVSSLKLAVGDTTPWPAAAGGASPTFKKDDAQGITGSSRAVRSSRARALGSRRGLCLALLLGVACAYLLLHVCLLAAG